MRDHRKCTVYDVQRELSALAAVLQTVEQRLKRIAKGIQPSPHLLPVELRGRIETVRIDLLSDAVGTLKELSQLTENDVAFDRARLADLCLFRPIRSPIPAGSRSPPDLRPSRGILRLSMTGLRRDRWTF